MGQSGCRNILRKARLFNYSLKFATDNFSAGFNNDVLVNRYQPFTGSFPINMQNGGVLNGLLKATVFDLFEDLRFTGVPSFAPEVLQRVRLDDPMKIKHLRKALDHFAEEGASQVFKPLTGADWVVGVVGPLQFEVLAARIAAEYGLAAHFEGAGLDAAR